MNAFWSFLVVFLGSSVGAAAVTIGWEWWKGRRQRELEVLQHQLEKLYGPLFYFTSLNQSLFGLYDEYHKAYRAEYIERKYASEARERVRGQAKALLEEANSYIQEVKENNQRIIEILQEHWHLIELDDLELFSTFHVDMSRLKRTQEEQASLTSSTTDDYLGPIFHMRQEMMERVSNRFHEKKKRFDELTA